MSLDAPTATRSMIAIAATVGIAATIAPDRMLRIFGVPASELTPAGRFGWRLFATRNLYLSWRAAQGDAAAIAAFAPIQVLDQVVFWQAFATGSVPRRASLLAATASGGILALDRQRRRGESAGETHL